MSLYALPVQDHVSGRGPIIRPVSSIDVARLAGVSQSAVSRTFAPDGSVSARTREKVLAAAATLGYRPNRIPAIMLSGRSHMVGVIVGGLDNPFYATVLDRFAVALRDIGLHVLLVQVADSLALDAALDQLAGYRVDAAVTALAVGTRQAADALSALRIPIVCFNSRLTSPWISTVRSDNRAAGRDAADLLADRGVRRPAWMAGPPANAASRERGRGFTEQLAARGLAPAATMRGSDTYQGGYDAIRHLLSASPPPDGLFCSNDLMACGAIDALRQVGGLSVPADVRVVGYDDIPQAAWHSYDLTSFDQQVDRMVAAALDLLATALAGPPGPAGGRTLNIPTRLVERGSTRHGG
ncbi:LacI family DNA-binding transcriptional regulator [Gluconacetobacter azotocaptans]|uniref:LacI family DNA-binding transcriptional regulator n=2 Tax=Gluconacetobacter azotocaptans TaxID=142834 RepID=A0A7W4PCD2_9PROT|nr:LacI family DNA-binding transcriptional regulator [Gluconacetobacter azotocaptans]MBB2188520.1 LacI family DNA-binding transcriptional regulator [Gluconacetobacter azotocaptans]GBQ28052.1 transcriptional regulator [Gluconacetobacter azotocaptans DSM 13594]